MVSPYFTQGNRMEKVTTFISKHIIVYRIAIIVILLTGSYWSEVFRLIAGGWLILSIPGVIARYVFFHENKEGYDSPSQLRFVFAFKSLEFVWRGMR